MAALMKVLILWRPELLLMIVLLGVLYFYSNRSVQVTAGVQIATGRQRGLFIAFLVALYVAMGLPIDFLAQNRSFPLFIVQMVIMTLIMPWLLLESIPQWMLSTVFRIRWIYNIIRVLTQPLIALVLYGIFASIYLIPAVFDANLHYNWLHIVIQWIVMFVALLLWWPLANTSRELPRLGRGLQLVYILIGSNFMMPFPVVLFVIQHPWYDVYTSSTSNLIANQQLGGILMIVGMWLVYGIKVLFTFMSYEGGNWYN